MLIILDHWFEIRSRLIYTSLSFIMTFMTSYLYSDIIMYICVSPFVSRFNDRKLIFTNLLEAFSSCLSISLNVTLMTTLFFLIYSIFSFLKPGLYESELYILRLSLQFLICNLCFSIYLVYFVILPAVIDFFTQFESSRLFELTLEAKISDYLELVLQCTFWISIIFQIPLLIFLCLRFNAINITELTKKRKEFIVICFIIGTLLSPPDIFTQLLIAFPLWMSLEITILICSINVEYSRCI